jgi:hypothetical protein
VLAVETTQWVIAIGSLGSALVALALAFGLKDWFFRPQLRLVLGDASDHGENSDRIVTKRLESGETAAFVRMRPRQSGSLDGTQRGSARAQGATLGLGEQGVDPLSTGTRWTTAPAVEPAGERA